jgi:hypothetical protein
MPMTMTIAARERLRKLSNGVQEPIIVVPDTARIPSEVATTNPRTLKVSELDQLAA